MAFPTKREKAWKARAELAEARLAVLEDSTIEGNHGEWYASHMLIVATNADTLTEFADAVLAAQKEQDVVE